MTGEIKERVNNPNELNDIKSRVKMHSKLVELDKNIPNSNTLSGLYTLAGELQHRLYSKDESMWPSQFRSALVNSRVEFGSRVGQTIIDRGDVNLEYEVGNLKAWLGIKGLDVSVSGEKMHYPDWEKVAEIGKQEQNYYFDKQALDPASFGVFAENVAGRFLNVAEEIKKKFPTSEEAKLIELAASVQMAVAAEIGDMVNGGKGLSKDKVTEMIKPALNDIGMTLTDKE